MSYRPAVLVRDVAFYRTGDKPGSPTERFAAGTRVRVPWDWKEHCGSGERAAFRHRIEVHQTHVVVEIGGINRILEPDAFRYVYGDSKDGNSRRTQHGRLPRSVG